MSSAFDWNTGEPSTFSTDTTFNGGNTRKSLKAQAALIIDKTLPMAQRFNPLNMKQVTPYLRNVGSNGLLTKKYTRKKVDNDKPAYEKADYPQVEL